MLSQFILSLSKEGIALRVVLLFSHSLSVCFSTFCLDAKGGAKKSRQTQMAPPVLPANARQQSLQHSSFPYFVPRSLFLFSYNFFKTPCFSFRRNSLQAPYPASLFLKYNVTLDSRGIRRCTTPFFFLTSSYFNLNLNPSTSFNLHSTFSKPHASFV
jgi:hypothetical protein